MLRKKICGIYLIENCNGSRYVGQSIDIHDRWRIYKTYLAEGQPKLHNSFKKHGVESHKFEVLIECKRYELDYFEKFYINHYQTFNTENGMNLQAGGYCGSPSEETKKKISKAHEGKIVKEETKQKLREINTGKKQSQETIDKRIKTRELTGVNTPTEDHKRKISESHTGKILPREHRENISKGKRGRKQTPEQLAKSRELLERNRRPMTEEIKKKISDAQIGKIVSQESKDKQKATMKKKREDGWVSPQRGKVVSEETRAKQSLFHSNRSEEYRQNISKSKKGKKQNLTEEQRELKRKQLKERPLTSEQIAKGIETKKANGTNFHSEESKEKNRQAHLGKKMSDQARLNQSRARKGVKQSPEAIANRVESRKRNQQAKLERLKQEEFLNQSRMIQVNDNLLNSSIC